MRRTLTTLLLALASLTALAQNPAQVPEQEPDSLLTAARCGGTTD